MSNQITKQASHYSIETEEGIGRISWKLLDSQVTVDCAVTPKTQELLAECAPSSRIWGWKNLFAGRLAEYMSQAEQLNQTLSQLGAEPTQLDQFQRSLMATLCQLNAPAVVHN